MMIGRCLAAALVVLGATALSYPMAQAQSSRTIKLIVPSTPGGGADVLARLLADQIAKAQGQTVVVENRPGAGNTIGTEAVSRAAPDGNTLLLGHMGTHAAALTLTPNLAYDPLLVTA